MARQVNKTAIGVFVISVIVMLIGGVILLGGGAMFKKKVKYVMFFGQSIKGLSQGAPVVFKGVEIGSVSSIALDYDTEKLEVNIPVIVEFDPSLVRIKGRISRSKQELRQNLTHLIGRGFRARLESQSMVTGQLMIEMDFFPDTPVRLTNLKSDYPEMPTIPSSMEQLAQKLRELPIDKIVDRLAQILDNIEKLTGDVKLKNILDNVETASKNLDSLILNFEDRTDKLLDNLVTVSGDAKELMGDARKIVRDVDGEIQPLSDRAKDALGSAKSAMDEAKTTLAGIHEFVGDYSDTHHKLNRALDQISAAAQSLNALMDYLERHPEALLKGKSGREGE